MKKMKRLSAAMALALSMGVASQVTQAEILLKHDGKGDTLLFPVYNGLVQNYFTVSNSANAWIQGHLRFRGAAWSGELLDFDVILSPGDVFVFRVADVDGDGHWEVDQSLDLNNFRYTAKVSTCTNTVPDKLAPGEPQSNCMDFGTALVPLTRDAVITQPVVDHHQNVGYIEFIGEAVLNCMDGDIMAELLGELKSGDPLLQYQTRQGNKRGVTAWSWSRAAYQFDNDQHECQNKQMMNALSDVPNVLSGTAFINIPGASMGLAYNAEAFVNFRTDLTNVPVDTAAKKIEKAHQIDNYRMVDNVAAAGTYVSKDSDKNVIAANKAVIVHDEDVSGPGAATSAQPRPFGDYVLRFEAYGNVPGMQETREDEVRMSFQNTWGPTLADGDDYDLMGIRPTYGDRHTDDFDAGWQLNRYGLGVPNSIAEVEEAIRDDGQTYTAYYFDGSSLVGSSATLASQYFAFFPTKVFWNGEVYDQYKPQNPKDYLDQSVRWLLVRPKPYRLEVWDNFEREACQIRGEDAVVVSPYQPGGKKQANCSISLGYELTNFDIGFIKSVFPDKSESALGLDVKADFKAGRVVIDPLKDANDPFKNDLRQSWPALMYTFELGNDWSLGQWRRMQR